MSGQLIYPEARAALAAAQRGGRLTKSAYTAAVEGVDDCYAAMRVVGVDETLALTAGDLAGAHGLRGYDAVHLASALAVGADNVVFATWDTALAAAALATGLRVNKQGG